MEEDVELGVREKCKGLQEIGAAIIEERAAGIEEEEEENERTGRKR